MDSKITLVSLYAKVLRADSENPALRQATLSNQIRALLSR
jgi:hypothetical protein